MMQPPLVVLIEDNPGDVLLVEKALEAAGVAHKLCQFKDGTEAIRVLCGPDGPERLAPAVILLDLKTPRSDGFEILIKLRQTPHLAQVPVAVLTSSRAQTDRLRAKAQGAGYIEKPSQLQEFFNVVGGTVREMLKYNSMTEAEGPVERA